MLKLHANERILSSRARDVPRHRNIYIQKRKDQEQPMPYDPYSRANQQFLDGAIVGVAFYLACLIGYDGSIPLSGYQFWGFLLAMVAGRLLLNFSFGLHRIQWRYIGLRGAFFTPNTY